MNYGFNPYLPSWEYIPDAEPHVFGDRVYIYGSHDRFNGHAFCLNDYVCYSAPVTNLKDWQYEGVIYGRSDDPKNADGEMCLYAPDVTKGPDGRYYLYYVLDALPIVSVAVCDSPAGKYQFYGYVHYEDGVLLGERDGDEPNFDPGVLVENGRCYLYTGSCPYGMKERKGPMVTVLDSDMMTVLEGPRTIAPSQPYSAGSGYEGHEYFEAASIRKINNKYYFIYSSVLCHELCYAVSDSPVEGFRFMGTIVSNTDRGIGTYKEESRPMAFDDNNHGSIEKINGKWYVFYHRHTNSYSFSRQACLEPIEILEDGTIPQVEITSCGPNNGPLPGEGEHSAYIACHLTCNASESVGMGVPGKRRDGRFPYLTQDGKDGDEVLGYVANLNDGSMAGFKYFDCKSTKIAAVSTRGWCLGELEVLLKPDGEVIGTIPVGKTNEWKSWPAAVCIPDGVQSIYFRYRGHGCISLNSFTLIKEKYDSKILFSDAVWGESPRWDGNNIWFSDIFGEKVRCVTTEGIVVKTIPVKTKPSGLGILKDGAVLISSGDCTLLRCEADSENTEVVADLGELAIGVNDMTVDAQERAYIGCYQFDIRAYHPGVEPKGSIALVYSDGTIQTAADDLQCPNGMVITPDGKFLVVADTMAKELVKYSVNADGTLTDRKCWAKLPWGPDGISMDDTGAVWAAVPDGGMVVRVLDGGQITHRVRMTTTPLACEVFGRKLIIVTVPVHNGKVDKELCNPQVEENGGGSQIELVEWEV